MSPPPFASIDVSTFPFFPSSPLSYPSTTDPLSLSSYDDRGGDADSYSESGGATEASSPQRSSASSTGESGGAKMVGSPRNPFPCPTCGKNLSSKHALR